MKKALYIFILSFVLSSCLFAVSGSFDFGLLWNVTNNEITTISILDFDDDTSITTKDLEMISEMQPVCRIRFTTNKAGIHTIKYYATPLTNGSFKAGYLLQFNISDEYNDSVALLEVGNESEKYPDDSSVVANVLSIPHNKGVISSDISVYVTLNQLDEMGIGSNQATITIEQEAL